MVLGYSGAILSSFASHRQMLPLLASGLQMILFLVSVLVNLSLVSLTNVSSVICLAIREVLFFVDKCDGPINMFPLTIFLSLIN